MLYLLGAVTGLFFLLPICVVLILRIYLWFIGRAKLHGIHDNNSREGKAVVVGFFHPYCNAGGGGERVLWCAIRALQLRYKHVHCVVYTGDTGATATSIVQKAKDCFGITLPCTVEFVFLTRRPWVEASKWPRFTLLGQSVGSMWLAWEAMTKLTPDIYIDTMGYAFTLPMFRYLGGSRVACYVHYPTISTDMLARVADRRPAHNNASFITDSGALSHAKLAYYHVFAWLYGVVGRQSDCVMCNSSWTGGHIRQLWGVKDRMHVVFPPCSTAEFSERPLVADDDDAPRTIISVAQFRPEKDHPLQIRSFARFVGGVGKQEQDRYRLVLVGSCRNAEDEARVEQLRQLCTEHRVDDLVDFKINIPYVELKRELGSATIGLHTMWNEHFGIGVVEYMAAGTIVLAHDSGGPKLDIVVEHDGKRTGFLADSEASFADAMKTIFALSPGERFAVRENARRSSMRFSEDVFEVDFMGIMVPIVEGVHGRLHAHDQ
ncbi:PREDICTED: GDP-Man:Man(3)GlcNAc(2)-PP-Dol alpha-1,2-mannosyltransferase-like [Priapulus caudatus]|uniref:GDP-Man:Man(3)GlcNAc(2)-PP-Dol alpha-1,2-mannosyltransferase n=1 Tax=Priapulus caudatus TaxID=37621 RepID=A0ABM1EUM2_PRICU|nr:PREDICTED: GDP-Man:Man(3)GlcNAc(2)-PP-Dol alpha-1,2-mannosyltransferase-like [Priapulus caudatus]